MNFKCFSLFLFQCVYTIFSKKCDTFKLFRHFSNIGGILLTYSAHSNAQDSSALSAQYVRNGMTSFQGGNVQESLEWFKKSEIEYPPIKNYLWQKGISQYFDGDYSNCLNQFLQDIPYNPNDTEEAIWSVMCVSRLSTDNIQTERSKVTNMLANYGKDFQNDRRQIMRTVGSLFFSILDNNDTNDIANQEKLKLIADNLQYNQMNPKDYFYSSLYLSLYEDVSGHHEDAIRYAKQSVDSIYAKTSNDYMIAVAKVNYLKLSEL